MRPGTVLIYYVLAVCITPREKGSTYLAHYQNCVFLVAIVTFYCTVLLLQKYIFKVCVVSFGF